VKIATYHGKKLTKGKTKKYSGGGETERKRLSQGAWKKNSLKKTAN